MSAAGSTVRVGGTPEPVTSRLEETAENCTNYAPHIMIQTLVRVSATFNRRKVICLGAGDGRVPVLVSEPAGLPVQRPTRGFARRALDRARASLKRAMSTQSQNDNGTGETCANVESFNEARAAMSTQCQRPAQCQNDDGTGVGMGSDVLHAQGVCAAHGRDSKKGTCAAKAATQALDAWRVRHGTQDWLDLGWQDDTHADCANPSDARASAR